MFDFLDEFGLKGLFKNYIIMKKSCWGLKIRYLTIIFLTDSYDTFDTSSSDYQKAIQSRLSTKYYQSVSVTYDLYIPSDRCVFLHKELKMDKCVNVFVLVD